ncbi:MAG: hypothetical protein ACTSYA_04590 [Candidatus Kariarchaeaceae archaeon]
MVKKSTANNFTIGIVIFLIIGSLFSDWAWIFSSKGTPILLFVIVPVYGTFIGIILLLQFLAQKDTGEVKEKQVVKESDTPEKLTPLKIAFLVFFLTGSLLSVLSVILYDPGEGVGMSILGAILAVIGLILALIQASISKN